ncbi:c-type cytochrome [Lichenicola sp.]|uniref:c-type cytochrome n=1 Tax=Lichenicola sp. TaxID=2804529 RepID=UPI003AFF66A0
MKRISAIMLLPVLALLPSGCKRHDMYTQDKSSSWDASRFFPNQQSMRKAADGAVPVDETDPDVAHPPVATAAMLERGHERYNIFCAPCHAKTGEGDGMIVQRGFPHPPSFNSDRLRQAPAQHYYDVISNGYGVMYSYAERVPSDDRWAVIAYIRALQRSQGLPVAELTPQDHAGLDHAELDHAGQP